MLRATETTLCTGEFSTLRWRSSPKRDIRRSVPSLSLAASSVTRRKTFLEFHFDSIRNSPRDNREREGDRERERETRVIDVAGPVAVRRNSSVGGKKQTRRHRAPRLPGASWTMRRGYYGARAFLRGGPIGGPLSRDDCNTFGAAYNIGTRGPPISVSVPAGPSLRAGLVARPTGPALEAAEQKRRLSGLNRSTETHTEGRAPDCSPLYPHLAALGPSPMENMDPG